MDNQDRISVSMTVKVGLPNYGSADVQVSYASTAMAEETSEELYTRVSSFVATKIALEKAKLTDENSAPRIQKTAREIPAETSAEDSGEEEKSAPKKAFGGFGRLKFGKKPSKAEAPKVDSDEESEGEVSEPKEAASLSPVQEDESPKAETAPDVAASNKSKIDEIRAKYGMVNKPSSSSSVSNLKR